jgi:hypothetical protein
VNAALPQLLTETLPLAPDAAVVNGRLQTGRYVGCLPEVDWSGLQRVQDRPDWWLRCHHKRWTYVGIGTPTLFIGMAVVDLGWCTTAFAYVFDRLRQRLVVDWDAVGLPKLSGQVTNGPLQAGQAWFRSFSGRLAFRPAAGDTLHLDWRAKGVNLQAELDLACMPPCLLAIGTPQGGLAHSTHKTSALAVRGWVSMDGQRQSLHEGHASIDSSNGLLARDTAWRWASAHRPGFGFNLQSGYFGDQENALWLDGEIIPLGSALFDFDAAQPLADWRIRTDDGLLDLRFKPLGARCGDKRVVVAASRYIQPVGLFEGTVRPCLTAPALSIQDLLGVTEDHHSIW